MDAIFTNPLSYVGLLGFIFTVYAHLQRRREEAAKADAETRQKELDGLKTDLKGHHQRICEVEDVDKKNLPAFHEMVKNLAQMSQTLTHHDQMHQGHQHHLERMGDKFENKFEAVDKDVREIKDCIKEIKRDFKDFGEKMETKIDATTKQLLAALAKLEK